MAGGTVGWRGAMSIGGRGWLGLAVLAKVASLTRPPPPFGQVTTFLAHNLAFTNHLRNQGIKVSWPMGPKVARRAGGVGQVAGSIPDPFRQMAVSVGKNMHFSLGN